MDPIKKFHHLISEMKYGNKPSKDEFYATFLTFLYIAKRNMRCWHIICQHDARNWWTNGRRRTKLVHG